MSLESEIVEITLRALSISGLAALVAAGIGLPIGVVLGMYKFRGRDAVTGVFRALMSMPTVALGLLLYLAFSRAGPLGFLELLYTPLALIIGQAILVIPIMISITSETIVSVDPSIRELSRTLGADERAAAASVLRESLGGVVLALSASFSRAISELGVALMLGGNIQGLTRILTTSIALETTRGEIALGLGLTVILLVLMVVFNLMLNQAEKRVRWWLWE
ncbi:MAG: ABC transporter permease [Candidatus Thorarchaeota archaeon]|nr:ABC transporter permease [Candidatus Thorarchaeota archaeon]